MRSFILHDKKTLEAFLRLNTPLYIYHIGDLDEFYWDYTIWFALEEEGILRAVLLLYTAVNPPVLLALAKEEDTGYLRTLIKNTEHILPPKFYSHLTPGIESAFASDYELKSFGNYQKMFLADKGRIISSASGDVMQLSPEDIDDVMNLYSESYPENSFDPRMLETGLYYGVRDNGKLISISGVHVYSEEFKVAALGNITTHPNFRGKGIGRKVTNHLCDVLLRKVDDIGLNVSRDNLPAIKCYTNLGFRYCAPYMEFMIERKQNGSN